jgi:hypothetical protein
MLRKWQKLLSGIEAEISISEKASSHHIESFEIVAPSEGEDQEQNHGGQDVCQDVPDAPEREEAQGEKSNSAEEKEVDIEAEEIETEHTETEDEAEPEETDEVETENETEPELENEDENAEHGDYNRRSFYRKQDDYRRRLQVAFAIIIGKVAEDLGVYATDGDDVWDVEALAIRRFDHSPLQSCRQGKERERVVLALDFSGSCWDYSFFFQALAKVAEKFGDVEVFDASNGFDTSDEGRNLCLTDGKEYPFSHFKNRTIIFFGDFDGGASLVKLSQIAKVYWFSCEDRYYDLDEHSWCEGYRLRDFRGKYFLCFNERDFLSLAKKIR